MVSPTQTGAGGRRDPLSAAGNAVQKKTIAKSSAWALRRAAPGRRLLQRSVGRHVHPARIWALPGSS
jgi:hypothetical protein